MRFLATLLTLGLAAPLGAQTLGRLDFPHSGQPAATAPFLRGVALMHSFEYEDAARAFQEAQRADPGFALAYWGEAMTHTHSLWNRQDLPAARAILARLGPNAAARAARAPTEKERAWLGTLEALYGSDAPKPLRDSLYSDALARMLERWPDDDEVRAFYALSLMGLSQATRNIPTYMRAGALAQEIYHRNPAHPGALHYVIHAFDDPVHAPLGLHAAREYSVIAADADHAQHMTTHIFLALGMWEETVRQNGVASGSDTTRWRPGHYTSWLNYGLVQQGKHAEAFRQLERMRANMGIQGNPRQRDHMLTMRAHYLLGTADWNGPAAEWALDTLGLSPVPRAMDAYARGVLQLERGRRGAAEGALAELERIARGARPETAYGGSTVVPGILLAQFRARLAWAAGKKAEAITLLQEAAGREDAMPLEFGPPDMVKPTWELLGEYLLATGAAAKSQRAFTRALELAPGRSLALLGLARAARGAGDRAAAGAALARLEANWGAADPGIAEGAGLSALRAAR